MVAEVYVVNVNTKTLPVVFFSLINGCINGELGYQLKAGQPVQKGF
jgi:hypothetical protein